MFFNVFIVNSKYLSKSSDIIPLMSNFFEKIKNTSSEMVDLYYWYEDTHLPPFMFCRTKSLIKGSVYV